MHSNFNWRSISAFFSLVILAIIIIIIILIIILITIITTSSANSIIISVILIKDIKDYRNWISLRMNVLDTFSGIFIIILLDYEFIITMSLNKCLGNFSGILMIILFG